MLSDDAPSAAGDSAATGRRATIQDVAATAGVSVSAVSKVLRDAYGVSPQMRTKVTAAIEQLGYRPHAGARGMRGKSYTIGVVLVELTSPFQPEVAQGVSRELEATPFQEIIVAAGTEPTRQKRRIEALLDRQVDGLILVAPWVDVDWIEELAARVPTVAVALHGPGRNFDTVVDDDQLGAGLVVDHLVELGHRHIAHTGQPSGGLKRPWVLSHTARQDGYEAAMRRHELDPIVVVSHYTEQGGYEAAMQLLQRPQRPTAIFAGADIAALGVLRAAEELGLRVPEDLTVTGYDNIYVSTINRVSLTTIDQSGDLTGSMSARLLLERINGERTQPVRFVVSPSLIARNTSGPAPLHDSTLPPQRADGFEETEAIA
ncbi:LacI family DNA-binding transcriptional regulator [Kineococcus sp. SYSU DK003]|uniref:LacI family DNA-binding transcriptional regulator n=1 Tax=Kineococcus sp. SYSU DK003 TaxID=3383124 RepID=UPI003D7C7781